MRHFYRKNQKKLSVIGIILMLFQSISPAFATLNNLSQNQIAAANGLIAICSGFEIKYMRIGQDGVAVQVELKDLPTDLPAQKLHCDDCIVNIVSFVEHIVVTQIRAAKNQPIFACLQSFIANSALKLPPVRAPPFI